MPPETTLAPPPPPSPDSVTIDFNYPLYLHPSDTPAQWTRCNAIVLSWIINFVSKDLSAGIVFASSATLVWSDLKERFDKVDGSRVFFLHREIATLTQVYFLTIVDDSSRMTWVHLLKLKSDVHVCLKKFLTLVKDQFNATVKVFHSDNGIEFLNSSCSSLFSDLGISHHSSCVHTPQQNGVAERKHKHTIEVVRVLKFHYKVPLKFWGECVLAACYIINRLPS
ncbi:hypothetical protein GQ457_02G034800 [Hibiscus cannabinus]